MITIGNSSFPSADLRRLGEASLHLYDLIARRARLHEAKGSLGRSVSALNPVSEGSIARVAPGESRFISVGSIYIKLDLDMMSLVAHSSSYLSSWVGRRSPVVKLQNQLSRLENVSMQLAPHIYDLNEPSWSSSPSCVEIRPVVSVVLYDSFR